MWGGQSISSAFLLQCLSCTPTPPGIVAGLLVQNTLKHLLDFGTVTPYLGYASLKDFFPTMQIKPNPGCTNEACRQRQATAALRGPKVVQKVRATLLPSACPFSFCRRLWRRGPCMRRMSGALRWWSPRKLPRQVPFRAAPFLRASRLQCRCVDRKRLVLFDVFVRWFVRYFLRCFSEEFFRKL